MKKRISRRKFIEGATLLGAAIPLSTLPSFGSKKSEPIAAANSASLVLWYDKPATQWVEALPIGNGRLGAMIFGGTENERLQLNEDTLYAGGPYDPDNPEALDAIPEARRLIFE